jgi:Alginate export
MGQRWRTMSRLSLASLSSLLLLICVAANAQQPAAIDPCAPKVFRWQDDCQALAAKTEPLSAIQRLRYVPLTEAGTAWLTLGGEYRWKIESLDQPSYGIRGVEAYTATDQRFLVDVDLRTKAGPRLFVQLSAATDTGRKPAERSFDESDLDLAQAFADWPVTFDAVRLLARIGRQEVDFGGNRLVAFRDAANLRRSFDLALLRAERGSVSLTTFAGHPVLNQHDALDDRATPGETFWGARLAASLPPGAAALSGELFFFARSRNRAIYQDAIGPELRRTFGFRLGGHETSWDYTTQASLQRGEVAGKSISAYGLAADVGHSWQAPWRLRVGTSFGIASGDHSRGDRTVGTFDPLYPNLGYFTDAPLNYPGNNVDVQPNITVRPPRNVSLQAGIDFLYRLEKHDAIYETPGLPLIAGNGSGSDFVAALEFIKVTWQPTSWCEVASSYVHAAVGALVESARGRDVDYLNIQLSLRL